MCPHVYDQVTTVIRSVIADLTRVGFFSGVFSYVFYIFHLVKRGEVAERTVEGFAA